MAKLHNLSMTQHGYFETVFNTGGGRIMICYHKLCREGVGYCWFLAIFVQK